MQGQLLLEGICSFMRWSGRFHFTAHSGGRGPCRAISQHDLCRAIDFRLGDYSGLDKRGRHELWLETYQDMVTWQLIHGDVPGMGCYGDTPHPFFHWDYRVLGDGQAPARWGRMGPRGSPYILFDKCVEEIKEIAEGI